MSVLPEIFEDGGEDANRPYVKIAEHLQCPVHVVWQGFSGLAIPEWSTPEHLDAVKATAHHLNETERRARNLLDALNELSQRDLEMLTQAGCVTVYQVEHLVGVLNGDADYVLRRANEHDRKGGRNPAAYIVAEAMRRIFRRLRRKITFGQTFDGYPSTKFGREVQFAIGEFGIRADWRRPARSAREKQDQIQGRLARCAMAKVKRRQINID